MSIFEDLVNVIAPHHCLICEMEGALICNSCAAALDPVPERCYRCQHVSESFRTCPVCRRTSPLYSARAITTYDGTAKLLLHKLKFERARAAAKPIAQRMALRSNVPTKGIVTHIPTANSRVRTRGYDQAELIAKEFARQTGLLYLPLLARVGEQRQLGQHRKERQEQMKAAFRPMNNRRLQKQQIILIDDVLTTGATCEEAARVLREAGAARVSACVFAVA